MPGAACRAVSGQLPVTGNMETRRVTTDRESAGTGTQVQHQEVETQTNRKAFNTEKRKRGGCFEAWGINGL